MMVLASSLTGCALWDFVNPFSQSGISVDAELVVGDKQIATEVTGKKEVTNNTAETVYNTYQEVNEQYPFWVTALIVLGWVLPTPSEMWNNLMKTLRRRKT